MLACWLLFQIAQKTKISIMNIGQITIDIIKSS